MLDKLRNWVLDQGYPLEMLAAKAFRDGGFEVQQSLVYYDEETAKSREIDLVVVAPDIVGLTRINFAVECKASKKPWVFFSSTYATEGNSRFLTYGVMSTTAVDLMSEITANDPFNSKEPIEIALFNRLKWMRKRGLIGYSLREAFSEFDNAYAALSSAMKAAGHLNQPGTYTNIPYFRIIFPIVVINAPLIRCNLDDDGELHLEQVDSGEILFTAPGQERITTCIRVVTLERLADFVSEAQKEVAQIRAEFEHKERQVWKDLFRTEYPV